MDKQALYTYLKEKGIPFEAVEHPAVFTVEEALALTNRDVVTALDGLPTHKIHCSVLAEEAIKTAVKDYYDRNNIAYDPAMFPEEGHEHEEEHIRMV